MGNDCHGTWYPSAGTTAAPSGGKCCYNADGTGCNPEGHYCDSQETCTKDCHGTWYPSVLLQKSGDMTGQGGVVCNNPQTGAEFPCGAGSFCCGGACAAPGSKCCAGPNGNDFPVTKETLCPDELIGCVNRFGNVFTCGIYSSCCGDICVGRGGKCCVNDNGNNFACGPNSVCNGNICSPPILLQKKGDTTASVGQGGVTCKNPQTGAEFPCGAGSFCCGGACAAPGSKCCAGPNGNDFPVTKDTLCPDELIGCVNRDGNVFTCGMYSSCCGDICVGKGGKCCVNDNGNNFACGPNSKCSGNICAPA